MNPTLPPSTTRTPRVAAARGVLPGVLVAAGLVCAVVLQLAGPRLQRGLAELVGVGRPASSPRPEAMSAPLPSRRAYKVAQVVVNAFTGHPTTHLISRP